MAEKSTVGRKLKYATPEEFERASNEYLDECKATGMPALISGLCVHMGFSRETLRLYKNRPEFAEVVDTMYTRIEHLLSLLAITGKEQSTAACIFLLKSNHGLSDRQHIDINATVTTMTYEQKLARLKEE